MAIKDLTGQKFGRLEVIAFVGMNKHHRSMWKCKCDCGDERVVSGNCLTQGNTKSCGCLNDEVRHGKGVVPNRSTHGMCGTRLYGIWKSMRNRCNNPNNPFFHRYGKKGIKVCDEWNDFNVFLEWATMSGYSNVMTIERIDNNKNYCPDNCMWIENELQAKNKSGNRLITIDGETHILSDWCRIKGIQYQYIWRHEKNGESAIDILTGKLPYHKRKSSPRKKKEGDNP